MKFRPLHDRVVVRRIEAEETELEVVEGMQFGPRDSAAPQAKPRKNHILLYWRVQP